MARADYVLCHQALAVLGELVSKQSAEGPPIEAATKS